jgi:hypothetical protein
MAVLTATFTDEGGEARLVGTLTTSGTATGTFAATTITTTTETASTSVSTPLLKAVAAATGVKVADTGDKLGFYGTAPVSQQTGVAVSAAGIHAACVALGLFTA